MKKIQLHTSLLLCTALLATPANAGFEWTAPPVKKQVQKPAPQAPASSNAVAAPAAPVISSPISPFPNHAPRLPREQAVPSQDLVINPYPQGQSTAAQPSSLMDAMMMEEGTLSPVPSRAMDLQQNQRVRSAATAPVMREESYDVVQGFGRDIPLAIAMSQVIPADYTFSFSPAVNPGASVSWQGGQPWDQILNNMLQPEGLNARIDGRKVVVSEGSSPVFAAAPRTPTPVMDTQSDMMVDPVMEPKDAPVSYKSNSYGAGSSSMVSRASDLYNLESGDVQPRPRVPARLSRLGAESKPPAAPEMAEEEVSVMEPVMVPERRAGDDVFEEGLTKGLEPVQAVNIPEMAEETVSATAEPVQMSSRLSPRPPAIAVEPAPRWDAPEDLKEGLKMAAMPSNRFDLNRSKTWRAVRGDSLRTVLTDWADVAGVDITWNSQYDYPLDASVRTQGTFEQAVQTILTGLQDARPRPIGRLHPNLPDGPPALIIETQQIIE